MSLTELSQIIDLLRAQSSTENLTLEDMRKGFEEIGQSFPTPTDAVIESVNIDGVKGESIAVFQNNNCGAKILYLHGGGYVSGSLNTHRTLAYNLAKASGFKVLLLDYRLAPEHPFPAAVEDAKTAYQWLLSNNDIDEKIGIAGDSAGGGLAIATCIALREAKSEMPASVVCISPWADLDNKGKSFQTKVDVDPMCSPEMIELCRDLYLKEFSDRFNPIASPLYGDLTNLPPLLIQVGTEEILLDDSIRLAEKANQSGIETELKIWKNMIHIWHLFAPALSEGREAIIEAANFFKKHLV